jgi:hypothetical protein
VPPKQKINIAFLFILLGFIIELGVLTFLKNPRQYYFLPNVWTLGVISTIIGLYWQSSKPEIEISSSLKWQSYSYPIFLLGSIFVSYFIYRLCVYNPINALQSDVIPTIQKMATRVLNLEYPFKLVEFPTWSFEPGYLTMQFLPFVPAQYWQIDYRYWAFLFFLVSLLFIFKWLHNSGSNLIEIIIKTLIPFVAIGLLLHKNEPIFSLSIELLDVAYYIFLGYSIFSKNTWVKAIALSFCLLSRYGLIFWVPTYAVIHFIKYGKKESLKIIAYSVIIIMVLYVIPFMTQDSTLFFKSIANYSQMAVSQWDNVPNWYTNIGKPYNLAQGLNYAIYFSDFASGTTLHKINLIKNTQIISCIAVMIFSIWLYIKNKHKLNTNLYLLFTFKLFLLFFYGLLFVPFNYLYIVPLFISLVAIYKINFLENA